MQRLSIVEEEEPTRRYLVFYCTYDRLNMFRAAPCPSSGARDYISGYHMDRLILRLLMVNGEVQVGWQSFRAEGYRSTAVEQKLSARTLSQPTCT
jgi:hypothetical protein